MIRALQLLALEVDPTSNYVYIGVPAGVVIAGVTAWGYAKKKNSQRVSSDANPKVKRGR